MKLPIIPAYFAKPFEELARAVAVAVGAYLVAAITAEGLPTTQAAIIALISGAVPIVWAALRQALNSTELTPNTPTPKQPPAP